MKNKLIQELRFKGLKATKARIAILELFYHTNTPLDAESILEKLKKNNVFIDLSTIYRFLNLFIDKGILYKIDLGDGKYHYELTARPHHHHIVCNGCGTIEDIKINENILLETIPNNSRFKIDHHHLEFFGLCEGCI